MPDSREEVDEMKAIHFPQANKTLEAPPSPRAEYLEALAGLEAAGVNTTSTRELIDRAFPPEQEVYDLPVWGGEMEGLPRCISCWEPSPEERALITAGRPLWLWVVGHTHPPLVLGAVNPFEAASLESSRQEGPPASRILLRLPAQRDDFYDIAEEYAVVAIDTPPGVMLWARVENRWIANPSAREVVRQLLGRATPTQGQRPTVAETFRELLHRHEAAEAVASELMQEAADIGQGAVAEDLAARLEGWARRLRE